MDTETFLKLSGELMDGFRRVRDLNDKARLESRDLSRREAAEVATIKNRIEEIRAQIPAPNGRMTQHNGRAENPSEKSDLLKPGDSVRSWLRENGHIRPGGFDEPERLSFGAMVRGAVTGNWKDAEAEQRALSGAALGGGGYLLGPELASNVIDRVRNQMRVMQAGATTVPMTTEQLYAARLSGGTTPVSWHSEGDPVSSSDMEFERITFQAKTLPVIVKISAELFEDLSAEASATIEREISTALSLELDRVCLRGTGSDPEPRGILNQADVTLTALGTGSGATLASWDTIVDAVSVVRGYNIEPSSILWASRTQQTIDKLKTSLGAYIEPPSSLDGISRLTTNQIPTDLTVGEKSDCSEVYVGRWSDVLVGVRTDMRFNVRVLNERFIDNLQYGLLVYLRADVQLAHPKAFNVVTGVRA
ncbi:MAG: phage major capsid protein [Gaiellaceae bacterium]|jgi:HK97 family phage major capsid protein